MIKLEKDPHAAFALIIDGKTLTYGLEDDMKHQFLELAVDCASVICCRVSPKQKALVSDYEIIVSECDLQDLSITPLMNALHSQKAFAMLDLSHNLLGNGTMEKLQKMFTASGQPYGDLTLDLHCN